MHGFPRCGIGGFEGNRRGSLLLDAEGEEQDARNRHCLFSEMYRCHDPPSGGIWSPPPMKTMQLTTPPSSLESCVRSHRQISSLQEWVVPYGALALVSSLSPSSALPLASLLRVGACISSSRSSASASKNDVKYLSLTSNTSKYHEKH